MNEEERKKEVLNYIKNCDMCDLYDCFDICRKRHNDKMFEGK